MQQTKTVTANKDNDAKYLTSGMANDNEKKKDQQEFQESTGSDEPKLEYFTE